MRATYALFLELSVDWLLPGFFDTIAQYDYGQKIDRGAVMVRWEFARIEVEQLEAADEPHALQMANVAAERLMAIVAANLNLGLTWRDHGRVTALRVDNAPNPEESHGKAGSNPAITCPKCKKPMVQRQGGRGTFWGCSDYPGCKGTRKISK